LAELKEAIRPRYYGNIRYRSAGDYVPPVEVPEVPTYSEPSTAAPVAADSSTEEEEVLQLMVSEKEKEELSDVAAAIAKSVVVTKPPPLFSRNRGRGRGVQSTEAPPSTRGFCRGVVSLVVHQSMIGRGRASSRGREVHDYAD
jgi:hypothetical protein